ncbi:MAG: response regulator [Planctomycetaceae bacterium]
MADPQLPARRIFIVDDTPATSYLLGKLLEAMGQSVRCFSDGESALAAASAEPPNLVISDLSMPGMNGFELARQLRERAELAGTALAALSGLSQESDRELARQSGFDHYLVKPVSMDSLRQLLASLAEPL